MDFFKKKQIGDPKLEEARRVLKFHLASGTSKAVKSEIYDIPEEWTKFGDTENEWVNVTLPNDQDASACLFRVNEDDYVFPPHFHASVEQCYIITPEGKMRCVSKTQDKIIEYPNGIYFQKGEEHIVQFLNKGMIILCIWRPKFIKDIWAGDFLTENNN